MSKERLRDDDSLTGTTLIGRMKIGGVPHIKKLDLSKGADISTKLFDEAVAESLKKCGPTRNTKFNGGK